MVSLTCLTVDAGCFSGPNGCPSGILNWASAQHEASQGCKIAKAEAASSLKIYILKFTQHHFCHVLLVKASHKAGSVSSGGKLDSFCWWEEQQNHIWKAHGHLDSLRTIMMTYHRQFHTLIYMPRNSSKWEPPNYFGSQYKRDTDFLFKKKKGNIDSWEKF